MGTEGAAMGGEYEGGYRDEAETALNTMHVSLNQVRADDPSVHIAFTLGWGFHALTNAVLHLAAVVRER